MISPGKLLAARNIRAKKQLGQHFLNDPATGRMIVSLSGIEPDDIVLEIGAGLGALTIPLAVKAKKVYAIDKDNRMIDILREELYTNNIFNVVLIENDILKINIKNLGDMSRKIIVFGNLPYNISSQVLIQIMKSRSVISRAVLMFQKELARRIIAKPGGKDYGRLSVMLQYCADITKLIDLSASLFFPKPKVASEVLEIKFKNSIDYQAKDETFFFRVIKAAFSKRRKTLKNALSKSGLDIDAATADDVLKNSGIDPVRRAETLSVQEFVTLSNSLYLWTKNDKTDF